jgi:hypothetical protein
LFDPTFVSFGCRLLAFINAQTLASTSTNVSRKSTTAGGKSTSPFPIDFGGEKLSGQKKKTWEVIGQA